ncbi:GIY-YIG nuclease family protein [Romboutsia sp. 1001713B170131_170501_G6]|uniref:GIY-YIG nuclease family protein n=1 Tax=Romboutsia sp. 1001713B170131_170501_G6 TaxID=2787108 RepID=UPI0018AAA4D9|nr:GIY-YIG nuclease family protein [Romboutsia sp. 1001713B170131_170501_G6]
MNLKEKINSFPKTPGIYLMKDRDNNIIYVGKSKKLQNRIKSYFTNSKSHSRKVQRMVKGIHDIEIIETDTELDALLLECEYIKKIKPMYNKLMKNHENYSYIKIDTKKEYPYIEVVEEIDDDSIYFGPYTSLKNLEKIKEILNENYKLRRCKKMNKCLNYDLNKCIGPCRESISQKEYKTIIDSVISDLKGDSEHIIDILTQNMNKEISSLNFEKASMIKDDINKIKSLFNRQEVINSSVDKDVKISLNEVNDDTCKVYIIYKGKILKSEIIDKNKLKMFDKEEYIKENISENIESDDFSDYVDKYDIDFMNIIYNYIK